MVEEDTAGAPPGAYEAALQALEYLQNGAIMRVNEVIEAMKDFRRPYRAAARYFLNIIRTLFPSTTLCCLGHNFSNLPFS